MSEILNRFCNDTSIKAGSVLKYEYAPKGVYHDEAGYAIFCDGLQTRLFFTSNDVNIMYTASDDSFAEIVETTYKYLIEDGFLNKEN